MYAILLSGCNCFIGSLHVTIQKLLSGSITGGKMANTLSGYDEGKCGNNRMDKTIVVQQMKERYGR